MKKLVLLPALVLVFGGISCQSLKLTQKPSARIASFDIESISMKDITLLFDVEISNPYPVSLKLDSVAFDVSLENKPLLKTSAAKGLEVKSRGTARTPLRLVMSYSDIAGIVKDYTKKDSLLCQVDTKITIPLPKIPGLSDKVSFDYRLTKRIPVIRPSIKITGFKVNLPSEKEIAQALKEAGEKAVSPSKIRGMFSDIISGKTPKKVISPDDLDLKLSVMFNIEMKNDTAAEFNFKSLNYNFDVNGTKLINGTTKEISRKAGVSVLTVRSEFSTLSMTKSVLSAFKKGKGSYRLKGESQVQFPASIKKEPLKLLFNESGDFSL